MFMLKTAAIIANVLLPKNFKNFIIYLVLMFFALVALIILLPFLFTLLIFSDVAITNTNPPISGDIVFTEGLGTLSEKYESNGFPGIIANNPGDIGGKSYGAWQIASNVGTMKSFLSWLKKTHKELHRRLDYAYRLDNNSYGKYFDREWKSIAKENSDYFYVVQWNFIKHTHYDPVVKFFKEQKLLDFEKRSWTLRNVVWSTGVQHGIGSARKRNGAIGIILKCLGTTTIHTFGKLEDDRWLIKRIYEERKKVDTYFSSSSQEIKDSVYFRFIDECQDAETMLDNEILSITIDDYD